MNQSSTSRVMWSTALDTSPALILSCASSSTTGGAGWGVVGGASRVELREPLERDLIECLGDLGREKEKYVHHLQHSNL